MSDLELLRAELETIGDKLAAVRSEADQASADADAANARRGELAGIDARVYLSELKPAEADKLRAEILDRAETATVEAERLGGIVSVLEERRAEIGDALAEAIKAEPARVWRQAVARKEKAEEQLRHAQEAEDEARGHYEQADVEAQEILDETSTSGAWVEERDRRRRALASQRLAYALRFGGGAESLEGLDGLVGRKLAEETRQRFSREAERQRGALEASVESTINPGRVAVGEENE